MAYIESDLALPLHHKTKRAARLLKVRRSEVVGCLHCLWAWAVINAPDGDLTGHEWDELAEEADWGGDPNAFIEALLNAGKMGDEGEREPGFLERTANGHLIIHDWYEHGGGKLIKSREDDAYNKWLKSNNLSHTEANYSIWKAGGKNKRRQVPPAPKPAPKPAPAPSRAESDGGSANLAKSPTEVGRDRDIAESRIAETSIAESRAEQSSGEESTRGEPEPDPLPALPAAPPGQSAAAFSPTARPGEDAPDAEPDADPADVPPPNLGALLDAAPLVAELQAHGVNRSDAERLAREKPDECRRQLPWIEARAPFKSGKGACLAAAIDGAWEMPKAFRDAEKRKADEQQKAQKALQSAASKIAQAEKDAARQAEAAALATERERLEREEPERLTRWRSEIEASMAPALAQKPDNMVYRKTMESQVNQRIRDLIAAKGMPSAAAAAGART